MWSDGSPPSSLRRLLGILGVVIVLTGWPVDVWAADQDLTQRLESQAAERAALFIGLLKRRAQRLLESRRVPAPPRLTYTAGLSQGYESNVNLDGEREGDFFTQETVSVAFRPRPTPWLQGEFTYDLFNSHYAALRDTNLWVNTLGGTIQLKPDPRVQVDLGYEYSLVNFPFNTSNSFVDQRTSLAVLLAHTGWLTHKTGWVYQLRDYDTRKARNPSGVVLLGVDREDQRHTVSHELRFRFPKTSVRITGELYRNFSNDLLQNFYDWEAARIRGVLSRSLTEQWVGVLVASHERRDYRERNVPRINVPESDKLLTLAGSLIYILNPHADLSYSVSFRYQDSNDPRLDFTDWVNRVGMTVRF